MQDEFGSKRNRLSASETRSYILDMLSQLAVMSKGIGEAELAILLRAIVAARRMPGQLK